ncbi:apolipoprotein B-100 isoform X2 [Nothobranchius furzeri]|uniref:Apolipoprotein B-100-like n=1 Tax=Nothobranchius furzeri TaxID=105023 RepID=A0A9D3BB75_NOTFU|nr:apolipoprotein B-100-like [Nothobranchius furzeri]
MLAVASLFFFTEDQEETPSCQWASRFQVHKKYEYRYSTEARNGVLGAANLQNGPRVSCQVEIEVPQMCRFIMQTRDCFLSQVSIMDPQGQPVYGPAPGSDAFRASMEKNPLKFSVDSLTRVQLFPETDEPLNTLNIKRGIISALLVPMEEQQSSFVSSVHGRCLTEYVVNSRQEIPTDVNLSRDLSQCDQFYSRRQTSSPLALLQHLHIPMSRLIRSTQSCRYQFDPRGAHVRSASCTETHVYLPFSHLDNGISSVVTQELSFQGVKRISTRTFDAERLQAKPLHFQDPEDKSPVQTKEAVLRTLQELVALAGSDQGPKRTSLFQKLVSSMRVLRNETLSQVVSEMVEVSRWLTFQALIQCGTPECSSAIMQLIRTMDGAGLELDFLVYGLSLLADPDAARVRVILSMAQSKQTRAIMFALAHTVRRFHKGDVTPEVTEVSKFMEMLLNDCSVEEQDSDLSSDPEEVAFLVLKVVGVMGQAMQDVSPALVSSVLRCVQKTDILLSNQKEAIRALRRMELNDEIRTALIEVYQDPQSPVEKRLAAYLALMKNLDPTLIRDVLKDLKDEKEEIKNFVVSHLKNLQNSEDQTSELREVIESALRDHPDPKNRIWDGLSQNYKVDSPLGSVQTNIIFDESSTMPKEMTLEATMKAFHLKHDVLEVGVDAVGFGPTIEALFGRKGFFPESISRLMDFAGDAPMVREIRDRMFPRQDRMRRQVPEDHLKTLRDAFQKLLNDVRFSPSPEATAYLRLLGEEIGYMKTSEMRKLLETFFMYHQVFFRVLPAQAFSQLTSSTENQLFFHYIFMDNSFCLPTASGFPLKVFLSGIFAPGAKGGLIPSATTHLSFMPSAGLEFITQMGVHVPDYVDAGVEMHTNIYHESSFNAKVTLNRNQIKLSIPAPKSSTQLFSISNQLLSISSGQARMVPSLVEDRVDSTDCQPLIRGLDLCTIVSYSNASSIQQAPYFPLTGETKFAVEIQPTGKVTEYTATIADETLREGKKGRHKVESLKLTLKAEGEESTEATASLKYNRNKHLVSSEIKIPDYDVEAGINLAVTSSEHKGEKMQILTLDVTNKNVPQLSLVGRARCDMMREAMLQLQMDVPSLKSNTFISAVLKNDDNLLLDTETVVQLHEASYQQRASLKYDDNKFEVEVKTDMNAKIKHLMPNAEEHHRQLQTLIDDILDQRVTKSDMKLRHIVSKGIEAGSIWLDKLTTQFPSLRSLRSKRSLSDLTLPPLPEKLFLQLDNLFRYQFNKEKVIISLPLPLGGKTSEELNLPKTLSVPEIDLSLIGLYIPARKHFLPSFSVPLSLDVSVPLLGLSKASTRIHSSFYTWEGSISGGNNTVDVPSYVVQYKSIAQSPLCLLSHKLEGVGMVYGRADDHIKYLLNNSFSHCLIDMSFSALETLRVSNKLNALANYKLEASSPLGLHAFLYYSAQSTSTLNSDEVSGDGTVDGLLKLGPFYTNTSYTHNYYLRPLDQEGRGESTLHFDSPLFQFKNMIQGVYANSELNVVSRTNTRNENFKHAAELKYKNAQLTLKCNVVSSAMGKLFKNQVELGLSHGMSILRIESQADDDKSRVYSLITGSLDANGLEATSEGSLTLHIGCGMHKASVRIGRNSVTFGGMNNIQCSPVTAENTFNGAIDSDGAFFFSTTKAMAEEGIGVLNIEGKITASEASLSSDLKGHAYDASIANNMNIVLNRRALTFTGDSKGALRQIKSENSHTLTLTLWTFSLRSKSDNFICEDIYYRQNTKVDIKPFVMVVDMINDLRIYDLSLNKGGHLKLEPLKVDLSGSMREAYGEEHDIKHTYELTYKDLAGSLKVSTSGNIMDAKLSHNCDLEFAGFSLTSICKAQFRSEPLRFDGVIRTMALPFSLNVDASVNSNGEINLHGKHSGQLASALLFKAAPLALACSYDSQVSTNHRFPNREASTTLTNKFEGLLIPNDQSLHWKVNSKLGNHAYQQDISVYNDPERVGIEFSGVILTDVLNRHKRSGPEYQKFSTSGFLKYDKNSDCHIIEIPFIESFPAAFENFKNTVVQALESLHQCIRNLDINQLITDVRSSLDRLPMHVKNFMRKMDLENKVNQIKGKLDYLTNEFSITMDDLELIVSNAKIKLENTIMDVVTKVRELISNMEEFIKEGQLSGKIENLLSDLGTLLQDFDEKYKIKESLVKTFDVMEDIIKQIDLQKLGESSATFLQKLDSKYGIMETIKETLSQLKKILNQLNLASFLETLKRDLLLIDWASYVEQFSYEIPAAEIAKVMESMNEVIVNWIDEYEIPNKLNAVYSYFKDLFLKYELDDILKELMDQGLVLIKQWKFEETVQSVVEALKSIKVEMIYDKLMDVLFSVTNKLKEVDFKKSIDDLNKKMSLFLESLKEYDYNAFVDETNMKIDELINYFNYQIKKYEIVEKFEALRQFFREIQSSIYTYLNELKNTKVADALKRLKDVIDAAFYNDVKLKMKDILEDMRQRILDMDIRDEISIYLQRGSESYRNTVAYLSAQFNGLLELMNAAEDKKIFSQMKQAMDRLFDQLKVAEIEVPTFTVPFTDLVIPGFTLNINKLQEISIPAQVSVPEITVFGSYTIPAFTIDFEYIKTKIVAIIDEIRGIEIPTCDPEDIFGDLKVLYMFNLPDLTFPEITLSEITFPLISIPKTNLEDFEIKMLTIPDVTLPEIPSDICIPVFGKLFGELNFNSPLYILVTSIKLENSTSNLKNPQFTATLVSHARSPIEVLEHTFEATAQLEAPRMKKLLFTETVKATHAAFSVNHQGSLMLSGSLAEASAKTTAKAQTKTYTADLINTVALSLKSGIYAAVDTTYNHNVDIPSIGTSCQAFVKQSITARLESGGISVTGETSGNKKWSIQDFSDEGTHKSNVEFNVDVSTAKLIFTGETNCKTLTSKQRLTVESAFLNLLTVEATSETKTPSAQSLMVLNGEVHVGDLRAALTVSHDAEFTEDLIGTMSNSLEFMAYPFSVTIDVKNKVNSKVFLPLKLSGKVDLQNNYGVVLNSEKQHACWFASARFNQYKYSHNVTTEHNDRHIYVQSSAEGEANLDFLTVPLSIPTMTVPYLGIETPEVRDFSLWQDAGLKFLLVNPQQSFDMNLKLQYHKNPDVHSFELLLEPLYTAVSDNAKTIQSQFESYRDKVVTLLKDSYNEAKSHYIKHKVDTSSLPPRIFRVPGYKIPVLNIQVSAFRAEMPAFSFFVPKEVTTPSFRVPALGFSVPSYILVLPSLRFPVIHVPETLSQIKLPAFTLPPFQDRIVIPALGNITCDFFFKSTVITLNTNAGLYNQSDIVARFGASSVSVFDVLNGKLDGTTSVTRTRGLKLASTVSLEHNNMEAKHECSVSLTKRSLEASVANTAKVHLPLLQLEFSQELTGTTKTKPTVSSNTNLRYMFNVPQIAFVGKGSFDSSCELEALSSFLSLETSTQGKSDVMIMDSISFVADVDNKESFHMNANDLRSTASTALRLKMDKQELQKRSLPDSLVSFDLSNSLALGVSLRRVFAKVLLTSHNRVNLDPFDTNGSHTINGELDVVPLKSFSATMSVGVSQLSGSGSAGLSQNINVVISSRKQSLAWSGREQLASFIQACDFIIFNDESETGLNVSGSVEGHLAFLKSVKLPVYQRSLWDVLKFNEVTNMDNLQFLNISSSLIYTKSSDGNNYPIPFKLSENGVTFSIPLISIPIPTWVKEIPHSFRKIDIRFESADIPDHLTLPPAIPIPAFNIPFTSFQVEPFTIDPENLNIPKLITTKPFDIVLPGIPVLSVPSYQINTEYLQDTGHFLSVRIPEYEVTLSSFTIPKSLAIGAFTVSLDDVTTQISNFQLPSIIIPKQKVQIPQMTLNLPSSVFIPTFGSLRTSLTVSSSIYKAVTTASVEKEASDFVASFSSFCTSTMVFLEYDLSANATVGCDDGTMNLNGIGRFSHADGILNWQHVLSKPLRKTRQISRGDSVNQESRHTLNIDFSSRTFADANFRFASRKDAITASVSSPSAGFLGLHLQRRSPSQLHGKLFSRYLSSPEKDTNVFTAKASLRNADKLVLQTLWNPDFLSNVAEGFRSRIPDMTEALLKFINKYHSSHFGFDLNRGSMKLKNAVSHLVEEFFYQVSVCFGALQDVIQICAHRGRDVYRKVSDSLMLMNVQDFTDMVDFQVKTSLRHLQDGAELFLDSVTEVLKDIKFLYSGSERRFFMVEMFQKAHDSVSESFNKGVQKFSRLLEWISEQIRSFQLTLPVSDVVINGNETMDQLVLEASAASYHVKSYISEKLETVANNQMMKDLTSSVTASEHHVKHHLSRQLDWFNRTVHAEEMMDHLITSVHAASSHLKDDISQKLQVLYRMWDEVLQSFSGKVETLHVSLKDQNTDLSVHVDEVYETFLRSSKQQTGKAQKQTSELKNLLRLKLSEAHAALGAERVNGLSRELVSILQSNISEALSHSLDLVRKASEGTMLHIRVGKEKVDVEIPLPFLWRSFSEWPTQLRH